MLRKLRSVVHRLSHRSDSSAKQEINREEPLESIKTGNRNESVSLSLGVDGPSAPQPSDLRSRELGHDAVPEILQNLDFKPEIAPERFFKANPAEAARGTFRKVDTVRWDYTESDWSLEEFDFEPPVKSADFRVSQHSLEREDQKVSDANQTHAEGAFERLHALALQRRWRAAAAALNKAATSSARLSRRELAAIEHILNVADTLALHRGNAMELRKWLLHTRMPKDRRFEPPREESRIANHEPARENQAGQLENERDKLPLEAGRPTQKAIRYSVHEIRKAAAGRNWLSPKSSRALTRVGERSAKLDRSDRNALNHLLEHCVALPELAVHVTALRQAIAD